MKLISSKSARSLIQVVSGLLLGFTGVVQLALAETCVESEVRSTEFASVVIKKASFCYDEDRELFVSRRCQKQSCLAETQIKKELPIGPSELSGPFGTPVSKVCNKLKGTLEIVDFKVNADWIRSDRCVFPDESFVSGSLLLKENRDRENPNR